MGSSTVRGVLCSDLPYPFSLASENNNKGVAFSYVDPSESKITTAPLIGFHRTGCKHGVRIKGKQTVMCYSWEAVLNLHGTCKCYKNDHGKKLGGWGGAVQCSGSFTSFSQNVVQFCKPFFYQLQRVKGRLLSRFKGSGCFTSILQYQLSKGLCGSSVGTLVPFPSLW